MTDQAEKRDCDRCRHKASLIWDILILGIIARQEQSITARTVCISKPICS
jgi:hypothetical protein